MIIQKFGGTSVGSAARIKNVAALINNGQRKIVVISAVSSTTNKLVEISQAFYKKDIAGVESILEFLTRHYKNLVNELLYGDQKETAIKALDMHRSLI